MEGKSILGLVLCALIFGAGFVISGDVGQYFNLSAFLIVFGGCLGTAIASFRMERLVFVSKVLRNSYRTRMREPAAIVEILVDLSVKSRISTMAAGSLIRVR